MILVFEALFTISFYYNMTRICEALFATRCGAGAASGAVSKVPRNPMRLFEGLGLRV